MTANRNKARRRRVSYSIDLQHSATVSNIVVNSAAVVVQNVTNLEQRLRRNMPNPLLSNPVRRRCRPRRRRSVSDIYKELGRIYFRRAYRMTYTSFRRLAALLRPYIITACGSKGAPRYCPNGPISPDVRLACAIRWFAGGSTYDIMTTFGISHTTLLMLLTSIQDLKLNTQMTKKNSDLLLQVLQKCHLLDFGAVLGP
jgi:hypothetical protein